MRSPGRPLPVVLAALGLLGLSAVAVSESTSDEPFLVWVVGFEGRDQQSTKHSISAAGATKAVTTATPPAGGGPDALADLLRQWRRREEAARALAGQLAGRVPPGAKWVSVSPDRRYGLIGFEDSRLDVLRTADLVNMASRERLKEFAFWSSETIEDAEWSRDSRLLGLLIGRERWSRSPLDLALTILGRPTPLKTFSVSLIDLRSLREQRIPIATDVRFGTSMILQNVER